MSTLRVNTLQDATGSNQPAMVGAAKAWVNFNGTGTVAIRAAFNVSSITDNGTGIYTINFTTAMPDTNYSWAGGVPRDAGGYLASVNAQYAGTYTTAALQIITNNASGGGLYFDYPIVTVQVFR